MDLRSILPAMPVEPGDEWSIGAAAVRDLLFPGGRISVPPGGSDPEIDEWASIHVAPIPNLPTDPARWLGGDTGGGTVELERVEDADGERRVVLGVRFELGWTSDARPWVLERMGEFARVVAYRRADLRAVLEGEGELEWNVTRGSLHRFEWSADAAVDYELAYTYAWDAPQVEDFDCTSTESWTGRMSGTVTSAKAATSR